jgi:hypothetical protein
MLSCYTQRGKRIGRAFGVQERSNLMLGVKRDNRNPYHGQWQSLGAEHWVG